MLRVTPIKLELQVPEAERAADEASDSSVGASVPGYPGRVFRGQGHRHQSRCGSELPHLRGGGQFPTRPGAQARHVRHRAHPAARKHAGNLHSPGARDHGRDHQFVAGILHPRRQGAPGGGAARRAGWRSDPDSVRHLRPTRWWRPITCRIYTTAKPCSSRDIRRDRS